MVNDLIARALAVQATKNDMTIAEKQQLANCERDRHIHLNKETLDKIGENTDVGAYNGAPTYDGVNLVTESILNESLENATKNLPVVNTFSDLLSLDVEKKLAIVLENETTNIPVELTDKKTQLGAVNISLAETILPKESAFNTFWQYAIDNPDDRNHMDAEIYGENGNSFAEFTVLPILQDAEENIFQSNGCIISNVQTEYPYVIVFVPYANQISSDSIYTLPDGTIVMPFMYFYAFENFNASYLNPDDGNSYPGTFFQGWNVTLAQLDNNNHMIGIYGNVPLTAQNAPILPVSVGVNCKNQLLRTLLSDVILKPVEYPNGIYTKSNGQWELSFDSAISEVKNEISLLHPTDTLIPLELETTYSSLQIRNDWQNVPLYVLSTSDFVASLASDTLVNGYPESEICLLYLKDYAVGTPLPVLRIRIGGALYTCYPATYYSVGKTYAAGWYDENDDPCEEPTLENMIFDNLTIGNGSPITSFTNLSGEALSALQTLSRMINVSTTAMGALGVIENSVQHLTNALVSNRSYYFSTDKDLTIVPPEITWTHDDLQLAIYLNCTDDIDVTFPPDTRFIGGAPNTAAGTHKLIGFCPKDENTWAFGGLDVEGA